MYIRLCSPPCIHHVRITFLPLLLPDTYSSLFSICIAFLSVLNLVSFTCVLVSSLFSFLIHFLLCFPYVSIPLCSPPCIHHVGITFLPLLLPDTYIPFCFPYVSHSSLFSTNTCVSLSSVFSFLINIPLCFPYVSHSSLLIHI